MQNECTKQVATCYFSCRKEAAIYNDALSSRAGASEKLNVSESSLRDYETGLTPVPVDVVVRMADLYGAPELQITYCKNDCPIGKYMCRTVSDEVKGIESITCSLMYHIQGEQVKKAIQTLLRIASDGTVTDREKEELKSVVDILDGASRDINDLRLLLEKRGGVGGIDR